VSVGCECCKPIKRKLVEIENRPSVIGGNTCIECGEDLEANGFFCGLACRDRHYFLGDKTNG
jgi:hypothetical protein